MSIIVASKRGRLPLGYPTTNHALDGGLLDRSLLRQNSLLSRHSLFFLLDSISKYGSICCSLGAPSGQKRLRLNITFFKSARYSTLLISFFYVLRKQRVYSKQYRFVVRFQKKGLCELCCLPALVD